MHVCTSLQTDNHASTPPLCFLQAGCPSCRPTNSVKALLTAYNMPSYPQNGDCIATINSVMSLHPMYTNNNNYNNVYGAIIMTKVIARVHPVHLMNTD